MSVRRLPGARASFKNQQLIIVDAFDRAHSEMDVKRRSSLSARIVRLEEHVGVINSCKFDPLGRVLMSAGSDKNIYLSPIRGDFNRVMIIKGHTKTVTDVQFSEERESIYSCSLDGTVGVWDAFKGLRLNTFKGHTDAVNSVHKFRTYQIVCSGSNDGTIRLWDNRMNVCSGIFKNCYQVTSVCSNVVGDMIFSGSTDNNITLWDIRTWRSLCKLEGHNHVVSGISLSPCGTKLLSNSRDNTVRIWDVRPYALGNRCIATFLAHHSVNETNLLKCTWHRDGVKIAFGTSDQCVHIWDTVQNKLLYNIPGHMKSVVDVDFHPLEPVIASCSANQHLYMHEI